MTTQHTEISESGRVAAQGTPPEPGAGDSPARSLRALQTGHVGINVTDTERSGQFYREVFGLELLGESQEEGRRFVFLGDTEKLVLTLWQQSAGRFDAGRPGLHHLSLQVESIEDVREVERRVRARGALFLYEGIVPHGEGADSGGIFFEDPDGTRLEVFAPTGAGGRPAPAAGAPSCGFF
jgi:lactoylglutathione lyase